MNEDEILNEPAKEYVPNDVYRFRISPVVDAVEVTLYTKEKNYPDEVVQEAFFTDDMKCKMKEALVKEIRENDLNIVCVDRDGGYNVTEDQLFLIDEEDKDNRKITLYCESDRGDSDYYGDYNYLPNPLAHYSDSKLCKVTYDRGSSHGYGIAGITVETTVKFIKMMGWEADLKYEVGKNKYPFYYLDKA